MRAIPRIRNRSRRWLVRRIARTVYDLANKHPHAPALSAIAAIVLLYILNK